MSKRKALLITSIAAVVLFVGGCSAGETPPTALPALPVQTDTPIPPTGTATATVRFVIVTLIPPAETPTATATPVQDPTATPTPTPQLPTLPPVSEGIWISAEELAMLPMEGKAWDKLKEAADGELGEPTLAGSRADHDVYTLAVALVYARTGDSTYRQKAAEAIYSVIGTEYSGPQDGPDSPLGADAVAVSRNLLAYVIAADLIGLEEYDAQLDAGFRFWINGLRYVEWEDHSLIYNDEVRGNYRGRMAGASRAAVAAYLGEEAELARAAQVLKGYLGDRESYAAFDYSEDLSWQVDPSRAVGLNPVGVTRADFSIDGALAEEMRRGCSFQVPPCPTGSPWEALQGIVAEAVILHRQGYDVWNWEEQAILRAVQFLYDLHVQYPVDEWWAKGDDRWIPWVINHVYATDFPTQSARIGKSMGWTDWTDAP